MTDPTPLNYSPPEPSGRLLRPRRWLKLPATVAVLFGLSLLADGPQMLWRQLVRWHRWRQDISFNEPAGRLVAGSDRSGTPVPGTPSTAPIWQLSDRTWPIIYAHRVVSTTGKEWMAVIQIQRIDRSGSGLQLCATFYRPDHKITWLEWVWLKPGATSTAVPLKIFSGLTDPADPSKFSFVVDRDGQRVTVDCQVRDDVRLVTTAHPSGPPQR